MVILSYLLVDIGRCSIFMDIYDIFVVYPNVSQLKTCFENLWKKLFLAMEQSGMISVAIMNDFDA